MKTKKVEYFIDLMPGWQDNDCVPPVWYNPSGLPLPEVGKRVRVIVELPTIGGRDAVTETYHAVSREMEHGFIPSA